MKKQQVMLRDARLAGALITRCYYEAAVGTTSGAGETEELKAEMQALEQRRRDTSGSIVAAAAAEVEADELQARTAALPAQGGEPLEVPRWLMRASRKVDVDIQSDADGEESQRFTSPIIQEGSADGSGAGSTLHHVDLMLEEQRSSRFLSSEGFTGSIVNGIGECY